MEMRLSPTTVFSLVIEFYWGQNLLMDEEYIQGDFCQL